MKKATRWAWIISTVAATGAGLVLTFLLSVATNNPALYERHYVWLFWVNLTVASLLVLVIAIAAVRLMLRVRRGKFGSRLPFIRGDPTSVRSIPKANSAAGGLAQTLVGQQFAMLSSLPVRSQD